MIKLFKRGGGLPPPLCCRVISQDGSYTEISTIKEEWGAGEGRDFRDFRVSSDTCEEASSSIWCLFTNCRSKLLWSCAARAGEPEKADQAACMAAGV